MYINYKSNFDFDPLTTIRSLNIANVTLMYVCNACVCVCVRVRKYTDLKTIYCHISFKQNFINFSI